MSAPVLAQTEGADTFLAQDQEVYQEHQRSSVSIEILETRSFGGDEAATYTLAVMYYRGYGVKRDQAKAIKLLEACKSPNCIERRDAMEKTKGILGSTSVQEEDHWKKTFSEQDANGDGISDEMMNEALVGNKYAQYQLGEVYQTGVNTQQNPALAEKWLRKSANQGYADAQISMAVMYESGDYLDQDLKQAQHWYWLAALQGYSQAEQETKRLNAIISVEHKAKNARLKANRPLNKQRMVEDAALQTGVIQQVEDQPSGWQELTIAAYLEQELPSVVRQYGDRLRDEGWKVYETRQADVYIAARNLRLIGPFSKQVTFEWRVDTQANTVTPQPDNPLRKHVTTWF